MQKKVALITGGAKGIGRQMAIDFAIHGYQVIVLYHHSRNEAIKLQEELFEQKIGIDIFHCDIRQKKEVEQVVEDVIKRFGKIDILINNAGIANYELFTDITEEIVDNMLNTILRGTFFMTQEVVKKSMLPNRSGCVINMSSTWGIVGASCEVCYSMAKAGIIGMTKALAKELALSHIRVNAIAPGAIDTDMLQHFTKEEKEEIAEEIPMQRIGRVEEVSGVARFLASEEASYITGQVISPNGGSVI